MIPSPLHLEKHFFTKIHIDACPNSCETAGRGQFTTKVTCMKHKDAARELIATLTCRGPFAPVNLPTVTFIDEVKPQSSPLPVISVSAGSLAERSSAPKKRVKKN
jgi:hypothetical protein